ncbi:MAG TPA: alpha/beta hydrolase [Bryobacteraceae bacterium]|nr:alpha/beta hydrolase [Bryobacteraceae bacterium]
MILRTLFTLSSLLLLLSMPLFSQPADASAPILIWPHGAPDETGTFGPEHDTAKPTDDLVGGKPVAKITDVTAPAITFYPAPAEKNSHTTVVVFPGGGYRILAMDLEGTEVCHWLNSIGLNAVLLKYRVPQRPGLPRYAAPLQDAQRSLGIVRSHANEWHLDPNRIGVLGFSAGGHLAAALSNDYEKRTYKPVDDVDSVSCRPDFVILIYPAYLTANDEGRQLSPELPVSARTPPTFLVQTEDDPVHVENSLVYYRALKDANVPAELHIYSKGRHGYGQRPTTLPVTHWPTLVQEWLHSSGILHKEQ